MVQHEGRKSLKNKALVIQIGLALALSITPLFENLAYCNEQEKPIWQAAMGNSEQEYELPEMIVEAERPEWESRLSPGTVTVIEPPKYKGEQKTLPELLKEVPGLHIREINGHGQYTVATVRGSTSAQVGVFVDGVLTKLGGDAATDLSQISVENVARIEVYRGYVPARFAGTYMGGVINIVTKKPVKTGASFSGGRQSWSSSSGSMELTAPLGDGSLFVGANRNESDGDFTYDHWYKTYSYDPYREELHKEKRRRTSNDYRNTDVLMKWQDDHWQVKGSWQKNFRHLPEQGEWYDESQWKPEGERERRMEIEQSDFLIGRRQNAGDLEWGWRVSYLDQKKEYDDPTKGPRDKSYPALTRWSNYKSQRFGAALDGSRKVWGNHLLEFIANYSRQHMDVNGNGINHDGIEDWFSAAKHKYSQTLWDIQLQDTITLNEAGDLWFTPSLSYNSSSGMGQSPAKSAIKAVKQLDDGRGGKLSYQTAIKKKLGEQWMLRGSYGTYARFPNLYELCGDGAWIVPSFKSGPPSREDGIQWDVGADWKGELFNAKANVALTCFHRRSNNLISLHRQTLYHYAYVNEGETKAHGVELDSNLSWKKWDLHLAATYLKTKHINRFIEDWPSGVLQNTWYGLPLPQNPEWEGSLRLTYRFPGERASAFAELHYTDEMLVGGCNTNDWQDSLTTVGLGCKYKLADDMKLTIGVNDLFNKAPKMTEYNIDFKSQTRSEISRPIQGRTYYMTMQWDL